MRATWLLGIVLVGSLSCAAPVGQTGEKHVPTPALDVTVRVSGDADVALVDAEGRRTGWYSGRVEDIPDCELEADEDEVMQPLDYAFHLRQATNESYRLLVRPRTDATVSIEVEGWLAGKQACVARADTQLVWLGESGESQWRLEWKISGSGCRLEIIPVPR